MSVVSEAMKPYLHRVWRVVGLKANDPNTGYSIDNYHLYTAHYLNLGATADDYMSYFKFIDACQGLSPGLFWRFPKGPEPISQDELIGIAICGWHMGDTLPVEEIINYGNHNFWCFNNSSPGHFSLNQWLGRFLDLKPFLLASIHKPLNLLRQSIWSLYLLATLFSTKQNTSGKLLKYAQTRIMEKYLICKVSIKIWKFFMKKQYGSPQALFQIYFPNHPLATYAPKEF